MRSSSVTICCVIGFVITLVSALPKGGKHRIDFPEEQEPNTVIANLARLFSVRSDDLPGRSFEILGQRMIAGHKVIASDGKWLQIDRATGVITVKEPVDREAECGDDPELECVILLQTAMMPQAHFRLQDFELVVTDVNDHSPKFPATGSDRIFSLNISEDTPEQTKISLDHFQATDEDIEENALIYYSISRNDHFGLSQYKDDTGASHLELVILSELDYEDTTTFDLTLTAKDRGSPTPRSSQVFLRINVIDANDNAPRFDEPVYNLELRENLPAGHTITTVVARDADTGLFGKVRYFVPRSGNSPTVKSLITVGPVSGEVKLLKPLDRETKKSLRVVIAAKDQATSDEGGSKTGKTILMIQIMDVNDNAPRIHVNVILKGPGKSAYVPEDAKIGTYVAHVSATDADNGASGTISLSLVTVLVSSKPANLASVTSRKHTAHKVDDYFILKSDNLIATNAKLDRETEDKYVVVIKACDHGNPQRCSRKNVTVVVLDSNDHRPMFRSKQNSFTLSESTQIGSYITSVTAYDEDARNTPALVKTKDGRFTDSQNGDVRYSLVGGGAVFAIESKTGRLTLVGNLDYEMKRSWKLLVIAQDLGQPPRKTNFTLTVRVTDVNDHKPEFTNPGVANMTVYATILENRPIIKIKTIDRDAGNNAKVRYSISSEDGFKKSRAFLIDSESGSLRLNASNKLTKLLGEHTLTIKARDTGNPPLESETRLIVKVTDLPLSSIIPNYQNPEDEESSRITVIVLASLASATVILLLILACIVVKCRKENKEIRTYNCRAAESKSGRTINCPSKSSMSQIGSVDEVVVVTTPGVKTTKDIYFGKAMEMNRTRSMTLKNGKPESVPLTASKYATIDKGPTFSTFSRKDTSNNPTGNLVTSSHTDGDSGKGESDKDSDSYGGDKETRESHGPSDYTQYCSGYLNELGPRCTIACRKYGHSDECWMPVVAHCEINGEHESFIYSEAGSEVSESARSHRHHPDHFLSSSNSLPARYGNFDNCGLETISETQPLRIVLDSGDQASMYSCDSYTQQEYPPYPPSNRHYGAHYHDPALSVYPPSYYATQQLQALPQQADWRDMYRPQQINDLPPRHSPVSSRGMLPPTSTENSFIPTNGSSNQALNNSYSSGEMVEKYRHSPVRPLSLCEPNNSNPDVAATGSVMDKVKRFSQGPVRRNSLRDHVLQKRFNSSVVEEVVDARPDDALLPLGTNHIKDDAEEKAEVCLEETKQIISDIDNLISS